MPNPVVLVTGVGPGTGSAVVRRFAAGGYQVAALARNADRLDQLAQTDGVHAFPVDVTKTADLESTLTRVIETLGAPSVFVHNAVGGAFGTFLDVDPALLARNFDVNVMALLHISRRLAPHMIAAGEGAIIATGNTSALRGRAGFAAFAPTKAAQRILAESMARDLGQKGVHVGYVVIDAVIDVPWARKRYTEKPDDFFIKPSAIADEIWHLAHQDKSAWSFNVEIRPYGETW
jgi:NAD(P)-dependent dehydrogenase (short-subunit alcohol dehydrogenase family)